MRVMTDITPVTPEDLIREMQREAEEKGVEA